jgi:hypothetical protein
MNSPLILTVSFVPTPLSSMLQVLDTSQCRLSQMNLGDVYRWPGLDQVLQCGAGNLRRPSARGRHLPQPLLLEHAHLYQAAQDYIQCHTTGACSSTVHISQRAQYYLSMLIFTRQCMTMFGTILLEHAHLHILGRAGLYSTLIFIRQSRTIFNTIRLEHAHLDRQSKTIFNTILLKHFHRYHSDQDYVEEYSTSAAYLQYIMQSRTMFSTISLNHDPRTAALSTILHWSASLRISSNKGQHAAPY